MVRATPRRQPEVTCIRQNRKWVVSVRVMSRPEVEAEVTAVAAGLTTFKLLQSV